MAVVVFQPTSPPTFIASESPASERQRPVKVMLSGAARWANRRAACVARHLRLLANYPVLLPVHALRNRLVFLLLLLLLFSSFPPPQGRVFQMGSQLSHRTIVQPGIRQIEVR